MTRGGLIVYNRVFAGGHPTMYYVSLHRIERNLQGGTRGAGFVAGGLLRRRGAVCFHHQHLQLHHMNIYVSYLYLMMMKMKILESLDYADSFLAIDFKKP